MNTKFVSIALSLVVLSASDASLSPPNLAALGELDEVRFTYATHSGVRVEITAFRSSSQEPVGPYIHAQVYEPSNPLESQNHHYQHPIPIEAFQALETSLLAREFLEQSLASDSSAASGLYWLLEGSRGSFTIRHLRAASEVLGDLHFANLVRSLVRLAQVPIPEEDLRKVLVGQTTDPPARPTVATELTFHCEVRLLEPRPVFDDYNPPKVVSQPPFDFPDDLKEGLDGKVTVRFSVSSTGQVEEVTILNSTDERLSEIAVRGVQKWVFEPRIEGEVPTKSRVEVPVVFWSKRSKEANKAVDSAPANAGLDSRASPQN